MAKTNLGLVEYAKKALEQKWGYVWGTFGLVLTEGLFQQKLKQYPVEVGRYKDFILNNWLGNKTADCIGLIKSYMWEKDGKILYDAKTDVSANGMYNLAKEKGTIIAMPDIPGICVYKTGHIGIYIGDGEVIEANGTKKGVIQTPFSGPGATPWTNWLKVPYIEYVKEQKIEDSMIGEVSLWAEEAWDWAISKGITDGTNPKGLVTREMLVTMLYRTK